MTEEFTIIGEWFIPSNKEQRVHGVLTFHPQNGTDLELYGDLSGDSFFPEFKDQEIILGVTSDSKQITLYICFMTKSWATLVQGEESGKQSTLYSVRYALIGLHANTVDELKFNTISTEIFNLEEWVGISGFQRQNTDIDKLKNHEVRIDYKLPEPIKFDIDDNTKGKFNFIANPPGLSRYQKTVTITQRVEFCIIAGKEKNIDDLLKYFISFQNFLTLALYRSTYPISITLTGDKHKKDYGDGKTYNKIKLFFSSRNFKVNEKPKFDFEMLFDYGRIKDDFPLIIKNWYSKYKILEPSFDLVFEQFYNGNKFTVNTFLNLAQSAETFHARLHKHTKIPSDEYKIMKEDILGKVASKYHSWLKDQFSFGNNLNLHSRLTEITEKYSNETLDRIIPDRELFVKQVKHSRNYYTHYSKKGEKNALKRGELFYLSERLKILLVCSFLIETGVNKENLSGFMDNIKWKLFNHLVNWRE